MLHTKPRKKTACYCSGAAYCTAVTVQGGSGLGNTSLGSSAVSVGC